MEILSYKQVQNLYPNHSQRRLQFCEFMTFQTQEKKVLLKVLYDQMHQKNSRETDVSTGMAEIFLSLEGSHVMREMQYQQIWPFNIFRAVKNNRV